MEGANRRGAALAAAFRAENEALIALVTGMDEHDWTADCPQEGPGASADHPRGVPLGWPVPARCTLRSTTRGRRDRDRGLREWVFRVRLRERWRGRRRGGEFSCSLPVGLL